MLVTGGTGFIGGRLVKEGATVRVAVRGFRNVARLARFAPEAVQLRAFDMGATDAAEMVNTLVAGCDTVFHLAVDHAAPQANVQGTRLLCAACLKHAVRRLCSRARCRSIGRGPMDLWTKRTRLSDDPGIPTSRVNGK